MHFGLFVALTSVFWSLVSLETVNNQEEDELLLSALIAIFNGLQYMHDHVNEINLDGVFGCRLAADLIRSFVESRPTALEGRGHALKEELEMLSEKAEKIVDKAKVYVAVKDPEYYKKLGGLLDKSSGRLWYPSQSTKPSLRVSPLKSFDSPFSQAHSPSCITETVCPRTDVLHRCHLRNKCLQASTKLVEQGYVITHQVLYLQLAEMNNCLVGCNIKEIPQKLKDALCSNVMRDAEAIASSGFPLARQDLFMEQIGLCGFWGYRDFYRPEWLRNILQWQRYSGCYTGNFPFYTAELQLGQKNRVKRAETMFKDGCLSHKTSVALIALAASIRFSIETLSK